MAAAQPGALPSNTIAHIPALSAFIRILLRLQLYAKQQRIYLEQMKPKKDEMAAIAARSLLAQVFPSTFGFISGRSIPAAVWRAAHLLLQHAQAGFLLGHGPLGRQQEAGW